MSVHFRYHDFVTGIAKSWERTMALTEGWPEAKLTEAPPSGGWSVQQVIQHLWLSETGTQAYIRKKTKIPAEQLRRMGWRDYLRLWALEAALASPLRFKAPEPVSTPHLPVGESWAATMAKVEELLREWESLLRGLDPDYKERLLFRHPVAGLLTLEGVRRFLSRHQSHHRRQIRRILSR